MLPIDMQIERRADLYSTNPQELQKRANITKELVDVLAMQRLKSDLDAVKRTQAMQAQSNPATIKDQLQQGLMSEYRQQAAQDMNMPSEMQAVERARQGMNQPQMAQGMMTQARPVQLAGGGIVAFANGGRIGRGRELAQQREDEQLRIQQGLALLKQQEDEEEDEEEEDSEELTQTTTEPPVIVGEESGEKEDESPLSYRERMIQSVDEQKGLAAIAPLTYSDRIEQAYTKMLEEDPAQRGEDAIDRTRELMGVGAAEEMLRKRRQRAQTAYEETTPSKRDDLIDVLTALGAGGLYGVGVRDRQLRERDRNRRMEYEAKLNAIDNTAIELQQNFGTQAASNYETAARAGELNRQAAIAAFQGMEERKQSDFIARAQIDMQSRRSEQDLFAALSNLEQQDLMYALEVQQVTANNAERVLNTSLNSLDKIDALIAEQRNILRNQKATEIRKLEARIAEGDAEAVEEQQRLNDEIELQLESNLASVYARRKRLLENVEKANTALQTPVAVTINTAGQVIK